MRITFSGKFPQSSLSSTSLPANRRVSGSLCSANTASADFLQQTSFAASELAHCLFRITSAPKMQALGSLLDQLLGANSFVAGTLAGFADQHGSVRAYDMAQIITLLVLAEIHENRHSSAFLQRHMQRFVSALPDTRQNLKMLSVNLLPAGMMHDAHIAFDERAILLAMVESSLAMGPLVAGMVDKQAQRQYHQLNQQFKISPHKAMLARKHDFGRCFGQILISLLGHADSARLLASIAPRVHGLQPLLLQLHKKTQRVRLSATSAAVSGVEKKAAGAGDGANSGANAGAGAAGAEDFASDPPAVGKAKKEDCAACLAAQALTAYPVDTINGCKILLAGDELDFNLPAPLPFPWQRSYSSDNPVVGWLGQGWSLPISLALQFSRNRITLLDGQHRSITFPQLKTGESFYSRHEQTTLRRIDLFDFELTDKNRLRHRFHLPTPQASHAHLIRQQDTNGNRIRIEYNDQHQPVRIFDARGRQFALAFDARQRLTGIGEVVDSKAPPTALMHYEYDDAGDLVRVRNGANVVTREFAYKNHILVKHAVPDGLVSEYEYNEYFPGGRVLRNRTNTGVALKMAYGAGKTLVTYALGRSTTHHFDEDRRYTGSVNALGQQQKLVRDSFGNVTALTDHNGHTKRFQYDGRSRLIRIEAMDGGVTEISYIDGCDKPSKVVDPLGAIIQYRYDKFGNLLKTTDPLGRTTEYNYNQQGLVSQIIDARGGRKQFEYNDSGQLTASTDCSGRTTRRHYTAQGHLWRETDPLGNATEYDYDHHGRKIATWHPDGSSEHLEYDSLSRVISEENGNGEITHFEYDAEGRLLKRRNALGGTLEYRYDLGQRLAQLINENGAVHHFEYDLADRLVQETGFDQRTTSYRYDAMGKLIAKTECGANGDEKDMIETVYQRDKLGRLIAKQVSKDGQIASTRFAYDALGRMVQAANDCATVRMAFDAAGQLVLEECAPASGPVSRLQHEYDALGNRIQTILPDGRTLNRLYYGSGHLHQINLDGEVVSDIERDLAHREINRSQGALSSDYEYDPMGRLISQVASPDVSQINSPMANQIAAPAAHTSASADAPVPAIAREYAWDGAGNLLAITDASHGRSAYEYDPIGRILRARQSIPDAPTLVESFAFDAAHNLLDPAVPGQAGKPAAALQTNRLTRYEDKFWAYDAHGNLIGKRIGHEVQMRLYWNSEHQLVRAMVKRQGAATVSNTEYGYDPFGRRIFKRDARGQTCFVWDGNRLLAELREGQSTTWIYENDSFVPLAQVQTCASAEAGTSAPEVLHIHTDHLGTPRELSDASGKVRWAARHKAWGALLPKGEVIALENAGANAQPEPHQPLRFQGQYFDVETGLHYNRFRYYDPDVGRFVSQDPIGLAGGENLYQYAPNPTGWIDPLGLCGKCKTAGIKVDDCDDVPQIAQNDLTVSASSSGGKFDLTTENLSATCALGKAEAIVGANGAQWQQVEPTSRTQASSSSSSGPMVPTADAIENAYKLLRRGPIWRHREQKKIRAISKENIQKLIKEIGDPSESEIEFIKKLEKMQLHMMHDTDNYQTMLDGGNRMLSFQQISELGLAGVSHNTPQENKTHLGNHDFVFFRCTHDGETSTGSRFGRTTLKFDPAVAGLFTHGWVSLHDMLSPIEGTGKFKANSRIRELRHDGEKFGAGECFRTSMEADTDPDGEKEDMAWEENEKIEKARRKAKKALKEAKKSGQDTAELAAELERLPKPIDMTTWRANPELIDKVRAVYCRNETDDGSVLTVDTHLTDEVFYGKDIVGGVALSVFVECRRMGEEFMKIAMAKQDDPEFLQELIPHLFRIEGKLPSVLDLSAVPYFVRHREGPAPTRNSLDGTFDIKEKDEAKVGGSQFSSSSAASTKTDTE